MTELFYFTSLAISSFMSHAYEVHSWTVESTVMNRNVTITSKWFVFKLNLQLKIRVLWCGVGFNFSFVVMCESRAFLKHSAEMVYYLDGRNVSVVLQGNRTNQLLSPLELRTSDFTLMDLWPSVSPFQRRKTETWAAWCRPWCSSCWTLITEVWPAFRVWCRRSGWWLAIAFWTAATTWRRMTKRRCSCALENTQVQTSWCVFTFTSRCFCCCFSPRCSCSSWTACGSWWTSILLRSSSPRLTWSYWVTACGSLSLVLSSLTHLDSELST